MLTWRDLQIRLAVQRPHADGASQDGLQVRQLQRRDQLQALAADARILCKLRQGVVHVIAEPRHGGAEPERNSRLGFEAAQVLERWYHLWAGILYQRGIESAP